VHNAVEKSSSVFCDAMLAKRKRELEIQTLGIVGKGSYGTVLAAYVGGRKMAIKMMSCTDDDHTPFLRASLRDIVFGDFESVFVQADPLVIGALQPLARCTLRDVQVTSAMMRVLGYQVAVQIADLHRANILHNDIKPDNVLIYKDSTAKLIDFSLGVRMPISTNPNCVTIWYRAPELLMGLPHSFESDVWSFGVLLLNRICNKTIIGGFTRTRDMLGCLAEVVGTRNYATLEVRTGQKANRLADFVDGTLLNLLEGMLHPNPDMRMSMQDVLDHEFWNGTMEAVNVPKTTVTTANTDMPNSVDLVARTTEYKPKERREEAFTILHDMAQRRTLTIGLTAFHFWETLPEKKGHLLSMCVACFFAASVVDTEEDYELRDLVQEYGVEYNRVLFFVLQLCLCGSILKHDLTPEEIQNVRTAGFGSL
jgi:serine/threonine protein kinase